MKLTDAQKCEIIESSCKEADDWIDSLPYDPSDEEGAIKFFDILMRKVEEYGGVK